MPCSALSDRKTAPRLSSDPHYATAIEPFGVIGRDAGASPTFFRGCIIWQVAATPGEAALMCRAAVCRGETVRVPGDEFVRTNGAPVRGGLSGWQQRTVTDFIEANLGEALRLADMAQRVRLSPYHFARAFKQSFGVPPHRYHVGRRIARAKDLLADPARSITGIARELGFAETSSFSSTFRRVTGASPSDFRRARF